MKNIDLGGGVGPQGPKMLPKFVARFRGREGRVSQMLRVYNWREFCVLKMAAFGEKIFGLKISKI